MADANAALLVASTRLSVEDMRTALKAGADVAIQYEGLTLPEIVVAAVPYDDPLNEKTTRKQQVAALRLLRDHGGLNAETASKALLAAAVVPRCSSATIQCLLDAGADARYRNAKGCTPLHVAWRADVVQMLIAAGADVEAASSATGDRPLHAISAFSVAAPVVHMLAAGADVNAVNDELQTPLMNAVARGYSRNLVGVVPLLLAAGTDPTIRSDDGTTALDVAVENLELCLEDMTTNIYYVEMGGDDDGEDYGACLHAWTSVVSMLARATAWWQRRHMLLPIRGRHVYEPAAGLLLGAA